MADARLVVLVPDGTYVQVLNVLLEKRRASLGIREIGFDIIKDAFHDSSAQAMLLLRPYVNASTYAVVMRDLDGSGAEQRGAAALEKDLTEQLCASGWNNDRVAVIVVEPEIEAWLRFNSVHMASMVRDRVRRQRGSAALLFPTVRDRVVQETGGALEQGKPRRPKEAFEALLREFGIQRSNSLYGVLASKESLQGCKVSSFVRFVATLQKWFSAETTMKF